MIENEAPTSHDWQRVKHFFIWANPIIGRTYFVHIDDEGQVSRTRLKGRQSYKKFEELWHLWSEAVCKERNPTQFEYPAWNLINRHRHVIVEEMFIGIPIVLILLLCALTTELQTLRVSPALCAILAILLSLGLLRLFCTKYPKKFLGITINEATLKVSFVDGTVKHLPLGSIKRYGLAVNAAIAFIVFEDGTRLTHLQHVSYWPLLRQHLLSKLEPSGKTSKTNQDTT